MVGYPSDSLTSCCGFSASQASKAIGFRASNIVYWCTSCSVVRCGILYNRDVQGSMSLMDVGHMTIYVTSVLTVVSKQNSLCKSIFECKTIVVSNNLLYPYFGQNFMVFPLE